MPACMPGHAHAHIIYNSAHIKDKNHNGDIIYYCTRLVHINIQYNKCISTVNCEHKFMQNFLGDVSERSGRCRLYLLYYLVVY